MSSRSFRAAGAQSSLYSTGGKTFPTAPDHFFDIERFCQTGIRLTHADLDLGAEMLKRKDSLEHFQCDLVLRRIGQFGSPRNH